MQHSQAQGHYSFAFFATAFLLINSAYACLHHLAAREVGGWTPKPTAIEYRYVARAATNNIVINNVRVFNGTQLSAPCTVVIDGATISQIQSAAQWQPKGKSSGTVVNGLGGTLLPGLIDSHTHPDTYALLGNLSSWGVTTAMGMAIYPDSAGNALRNQTGLTDFLSPGPVATSPGSTHAIILQYPLNVLISSPDQAEGFVANRVGNGSNYIKLVAESNGMTQAEHNAIVYQAHQFGQRSTTHAADYNSYAQAIASGTDSIQHSPKDKVITQDIITAILTQKIYVTPTLAVIRALTNSVANTPGDTYANAANSTTLMFQAGIPILAGTDSADVTIPGVTTPAFGSSLHDELENLVAAGLSPVQALRAATSLPAYYHGLNDRGVIAVGKRADLLLITGDPTTNISNTRNIQRVWNAGIEYSPVA